MSNSDTAIKQLRSKFPEEIPDAYIQGYVEFYKLKFKVTPDVLIPRPESELLVDEVINFVRDIDSTAFTKYSLSEPKASRSTTIIDIGTGSGNIAISIAKNLSTVKIFATDISEEALEVARENARKHKVDKRIFFIKSDLLSNLNFTLSPNPLSLIIVTNLPYIPSARINYLDPSVKDFEPWIALDGGSDGFELYRKLFEQIRHKFLENSRGAATIPPPRWNRFVARRELKLIVCEIDYTHRDLAINEAQKYFPKAKIEIKTDLAKKQRILVIKF